MSTNRKEKVRNRTQPMEDLLATGPSLMRPRMSKSKLVKTLNKQVHDGDWDGLRKTIADNRSLVKKCFPYLANESYRDIVTRFF